MHDIQSMFLPSGDPEPLLFKGLSAEMHWVVPIHNLRVCEARVCREKLGMSGAQGYVGVREGSSIVRLGRGGALGWVGCGFVAWGGTGWGMIGLRYSG